MLPRVDVSFIILNYNSSEFTISCVQSIITHTSNRLSCQIIIVDNNSNENEFKKLARLPELPHLKVIRSKINLGFSAGHMFGIQFAEAKYYFFLNNDCILLNDCASILFDFCEQNSTVGLCSPQLYTKTMERHATFDYFPTLRTKFLGIDLLRLFSKEKYPFKNKTYEDPVKVDLVSGSALFVNARAFYDVGGFDTNYFFYCEEEDLALRLSKAEYEVYLVPAACAQHFGAGSSDRSTSLKVEFYISFLYFYRKHYGYLNTQLLKVYLFFKLMKKALADKYYFELSLFILSGAHLKNSLRHRQKIRPHDF